MAIAASLDPALFKGRDQGAPIHRFAGETMGTEWSLALAGGNGAEGRLVEASLDEVIGESSLWVARSEICRFNRAPAGSWQPLSPGFLAVVEAALALARESDGAFDPVLGALADLWGFGPTGERPAPCTIPAGATGLWRELRLRDGALFQPGDAHLDLNGIAKGQAVDRAAQRLLAAGHRHFLIGIGGEYRGEGVRPDGQPWWVDVEQPPGFGLPPLRLALSGLSVATSGDYRRAWLREGVRMPHSIDPATARPIAHGVASVAVLGRSCMMADGEATAITVLGPDRGLRWAEQRGLAVQMLLRDAGGFRELLSPALLAMLA